MTRSRKGIFARNISSNLAGFLVSVIVAIFLTPFIQHTLGKEVYGLWTLVISMTGYYGLFDIGIRSAVGQYVTRYWANDDMEGVNRTLNTAMVLLVGVAGIAVLITAILVWTLPMWLDQAVIDLGDAQLALLITGFGIASSLPMALWSTVTYARERFDIANGIAVAESLLRAAVTVWALSSGHGIVGLAVVTTGTQILAWLFRMVIAYRLMPGLTLRPRLFRASSVRELGGFGIYNFLVNAADKIVLYTDAIIVAALFTMGAVTIYTNGAILIPYFVQIVLMVTWTMTPYATSCDARGDQDALRRLLLDGTRGSVFLASIIAGGLLLVGEVFLELWLGREFVTSDEYASSATILVVLTWATLTRASSSCGRQILFGMRRVKLLAALSFVEAALNLAISLTLVFHYGLVGVAIGTLIPVVIVYAVGQNILLLRLLGSSVRVYAWQILRAGVPVMIAMTLASLWADSLLVVHDWWSLALKILILLLPVAPIGYWIVMSAAERRSLRRFLTPARTRES